MKEGKEDDDRDLLEVLKFEQEFLLKGGYGRSPRAPRRPTRIFEDSPTCLNFALPEKTHPCTECALMDLVPQEARAKTVPCDHIPLNEVGATIDSFYRYSTREELEDVFRTWLRRTIHSIEAERARNSEPAAGFQSPFFLAPGEVPREPDGLGKKSHTFEKCANPLCITPFDPASGGMYFHFELDPYVCCTDPNTCSGAGTCRVKHFWLCVHCRMKYTLIHQPGRGIILQPLWREMPEGQRPKAASAH
jgi:hypothetical protein